MRLKVSGFVSTLRRLFVCVCQTVRYPADHRLQDICLELQLQMQDNIGNDRAKEAKCKNEIRRRNLVG